MLVWPRRGWGCLALDHDPSPVVSLVPQGDWELAPEHQVQTFVAQAPPKGAESLG